MTRCNYCDRQASYLATSEGDPYEFACDQCCNGEGNLEGGHSVNIGDARGLLAILDGNNHQVLTESKVFHALFDVFADATQEAIPKSVFTIIGGLGRWTAYVTVGRTTICSESHPNRISAIVACVRRIISDSRHQGPLCTKLRQELCA